MGGVGTQGVHGPVPASLFMSDTAHPTYHLRGVPSAAPLRFVFFYFSEVWHTSLNTPATLH